jgi:hypothetical protein
MSFHESSAVEVFLTVAMGPTYEGVFGKVRGSESPSKNAREE